MRHLPLSLCVVSRFFFLSFDFYFVFWKYIGKLENLSEKHIIAHYYIVETRWQRNCKSSIDLYTHAHIHWQTDTYPYTRQKDCSVYGFSVVNMLHWCVCVLLCLYVFDVRCVINETEADRMKTKMFKPHWTSKSHLTVIVNRWHLFYLLRKLTIPFDLLSIHFIIAFHLPLPIIHIHTHIHMYAWNCFFSKN